MRGCDLPTMRLFTRAAIWEVKCRLLTTGGWAGAFEVKSVSAGEAEGSHTRVLDETRTLPRRGGKTMYQSWGLTKILRRSKRMAKNSLKNFLCGTQTYYLRITSQETRRRTTILCWWTDSGEQPRRRTVSGFCWNYYICHIFMIVTILLHVVIVNLKLYHFNKRV